MGVLPFHLAEEWLCNVSALDPNWKQPVLGDLLAKNMKYFVRRTKRKLLVSFPFHFAVVVVVVFGFLFEILYDFGFFGHGN